MSGDTAALQEEFYRNEDDTNNFGFWSRRDFGWQHTCDWASVENRVVVVDLLAAAEADGVVRAMAFLEVLLVTSRARSFALIT